MPTPSPDFLTEVNMDQMSRDNQCLEAIIHALNAIQANPGACLPLSPGTTPWSYLTECYATICGESVSVVRRRFLPQSPA